MDDEPQVDCGSSFFAMPRTAGLNIPSQLYHGTARGVER